MNIITNFTAKGAQVIYGSAYDDSMGDSMRVTVVATGLDGGKDKEVAPLEKPEEQRSVWTHPEQPVEKPQDPNPWMTPRTTVTQPTATNPQPVPTPEVKTTVNTPETQPEVVPQPQPQPQPPQQPEEPKEDKVSDEWEKGWWTIRHDTK